MKVVALIPILLVSLNQLNGQVPFPTLNAKWCYSGYADMGQNLGTFCFSPSELIDLGGKTYSKISYRKHPYDGLEDLLYREENRKFYVLPEDSLHEILVYDFNLEVADTFRTSWGWGLYDSIDLIVQSVEYVTTIDGVSRKKITLENGAYYGAWLEGIGSLEWVFVFPAYLASVSGGFNFICHSSGGAVIYPVDWTGPADCDLSSVEEQGKEVTCEVYPNPVTNQVNIVLENANPEDLFLVDLNGKTVLHKKLDQNQHTIQISDDLKPGLYLLKVWQKGGGFFIKRFIKV